MKKPLLFISFFILMFPLFAQPGSSKCSTIVLENENEIPAYIEHIVEGQLFYRKCPDSTGRQYSIPVDIVKFVKESNGVIQSISEHMVELPYESLSKIKEHSIDKWKFRNEINNKTRSVSHGQSVKVVVNRNHKVLRVEGKWIMLTETELILDTEANPSLAIPKKIIKKIVVYKKGKKKQRTKWWVYLLAIPAALILAALGAGDVLNSLLLVLVLSLLVLIASPIISVFKTKTIKHPFNGEWEITYPANEIRDVKELYKLP